MKWLWIAGAVVVTAALAVVIVAVMKPTGKHEPQTSRAGSNSAPATVAVGADTPPPWPAPVDVAAAVRAAGLPMLGSEGQVEHIHAHLDVVVDGHPVQVPAGIGIDPVHRAISPLHTHDTSGVIHIESPVQRQFRLGTLGTGNPAAIMFAPHDQIAVIYGVPQAGETIPAHFDFPRGD